MESELKIETVKNCGYYGLALGVMDQAVIVCYGGCPLRPECQPKHSLSGSNEDGFFVRVAGQRAGGEGCELMQAKRQVEYKSI